MRTGVVLVMLVAALVSVPSAFAAQIEVTARAQRTSVVSLPPAGRTGDAESSHLIVRDRYGQAIGDMLIDCRWVTHGLRLCVGQLSLPLGAIAVVGASRTRFLGQLAVVGGTGRYVGADGTLLFKQTGTGRYVLSINYQTEDQ
jgi:hypothetical protein